MSFNMLCHATKHRIYQPIDVKRDQFRKYIESKGVIETISSVLVKLLETPVKPEHPIDFIRDNLGATNYERLKIEQLEKQVADYKQEVYDLKHQIDELKTKLNEKSTNETEKIPEKSGENDETAVPALKVNAQSTTAQEPITGAVASGGAAPTAITGDSVDKKITESETAVAPAPSITDDEEIKIEASATATNGDIVTAVTPDTEVTGSTELDEKDVKKDDVIGVTSVESGKNKGEVATGEKKTESKKDKKEGKKGKNAGDGKGGGKKSSDSEGKSTAAGENK